MADLVEALRAAVQSDPTSVALRLQLARALYQDNRPNEALDEYGAALTQEPANVLALAGAVASAERAGVEARATAYRTLLTALGHDADELVSKVIGDPLDALSEQSSADEPSDDADDKTDAEVSEAPADGDKSGASAQKVHRLQPRAQESAPHLRVVASDGQLLDEDMERPQITLKDVGGLEHVKERLRMSFLEPLKNPELVKSYGKSLRGGLLLYGPPGCGKTYVAKATAGELGASFLSVKLVDVLDMWIGESEKKVHELFVRARRNAPCLVFFDEIDALGHKRSQLRNHAGRNVVNMLLSELDGIDGDNDGVFVLAATNHPWDVDSALKRPGRFDRMLLVLPPDVAARKAILDMLLAPRPVDGVDTTAIARVTPEYSGADLRLVVERAVEEAMRIAMRSGQVQPITQKHLEHALGDVRPSTGAWFQTAKNYALFANENGEYDDLVRYIDTKGRR